MATDADLDTLKNEVQLLRSRVDQIEQSQSEKIGPASADELAAVHRLTREVFGIDPTFKVEQYVECGGSYVVVEVPVQGTDEEISTLSEAWHQKMAQHTPVLPSFALSMQFEQ